MGEQPSSFDTPDKGPWIPTAELRAALTAGTWATLLAGILLVIQSGLATLTAHDVIPAFAHGLGWLVLLPGFWVARAYSKLGKETGYVGLATSTVCLFGALILFQVMDLIWLEMLSPVGQTVLWVVLALGVIFLGLLPFGLHGAAAAAKLSDEDKALIVAGAAELEVGSRVLAHYRKSGQWYAGSVQSVQDNGFQIAYDDGDRETVTADSVVAEILIAVDQLAIGDKVFARWWGGSCYYFGEVIGQRAGKVQIHYNDGDKEWSKRDVVRLCDPADPARTAGPQTAVQEAQPTEAEAPPRKSAAGAIAGGLGALGVVIFTILKVVGKGAAIFAIGRGARAAPAGFDWWELIGVIVMGLFLLMVVVYFVWFAVAKIVAASRLGAVAAVVGLAELLGFVGLLVVVGWFGVQYAIAADQPGLNDQQLQQLEQQFTANTVPFEILFAVVWASLTMMLFWSLRSRHADAW